MRKQQNHIHDKYSKQLYANRISPQFLIKGTTWSQMIIKNSGDIWIKNNYFHRGMSKLDE